jgi:hypothetical protein
MKREVLISECDRCHLSVQAPLAERRGRWRGREDLDKVLPPGWLHVQADTATHTVFEVDLCEDCKVAVLDAAGSRRRA